MNSREVIRNLTGPLDVEVGKDLSATGCELCSMLGITCSVTGCASMLPLVGESLGVMCDYASPWGLIPSRFRRGVAVRGSRGVGPE